jgi:ferritin
MTMPGRGHRASVTRPALDRESPLGNQLRVSHGHVAAGAWVWSRGLHGIATVLFAMSSRHVDLAHAVARAAGRHGAPVFEPLEAPPSQFPDLDAALHQTLRLERDAVAVLDASTNRAGAHGDVLLASNLNRVLRDQRRLQRVAHSLVDAAERHGGRPEAADHWAWSCDPWLRSMMNSTERF